MDKWLIIKKYTFLKLHMEILIHICNNKQFIFVICICELQCLPL